MLQEMLYFEQHQYEKVLRMLKYVMLLINKEKFHKGVYFFSFNGKCLYKVMLQ